MANPAQDLRINPQRFKEDFDTLSAIGSTGDGGVHRPSFSEAHLAARDWFGRRSKEAGLEFRVDPAGNHSAFLDCGPASAPTLLLGSHLDSVPYGGRYDGALGVLAALEVLRAVKKSGHQLPVNLEAIDFSDEEGTFVGMLGSRALVGALTPDDLLNPIGGRDQLLAGLERAGLDEDGFLRAGRGRDSIAGYLELHVEQGPRLLKEGAEIGIVTSIAGICSYRLTFIGRADHSGTTPMEDRRDAAAGATSFTQAARQMVINDFPGCVTNVGRMDFTPGVFNIVPERVSLALEFRAPDALTFEKLDKAMLELAGAEAERFGLGLQIESHGKHPPGSMSSQAQSAISGAVQALGLKHIQLTSGAYHDAQSMAEMCPAGMIFVPSQGGASHSPREFTTWQDCVNGANVLLGAAIRLAFEIG